MKRLTERERLTRKYGEHYVCNAEPEVCDLQKKKPKDDDCCCDCAIQERMIDKLGAYENIGTLEECMAARAKMRPKMPYVQQDNRNNDCMECPECDSFIGFAYDCKDEFYQSNYCAHCGQALDWNESEG